MKSHIFRPIYILIVVGVIGLIVRSFLVPADFKAANGDYKYQWHRIGSEDFWKNFTVKYKGTKSCADCHTDKFDLIKVSKHAMIQCENCHGPGLEHPDKPVKLAIDRSRELCLRCHARLPYRPVIYKALPKGGNIPFKMLDPDDHNPEYQCVECHDVHKADFKL